MRLRRKLADILRAVADRLDRVEEEVWEALSNGDLQLAAFRLPKELRERATRKAKAEDLTFSQLMRRALRREITAAGVPATSANGGRAR